MQTKAKPEDSHILPRRGQKRQQKQSNCLACVNQFSMAFATLSTDSVYNERKHPRKAGKEKQKTAPKKYPMILCNVSKDKSPSIQYYFAKYPCFVFLPSLPHPTRKTSGANRPKQFRDAKGRNHPGQQMRSPTPSCQTWIYAKQARCKKQKRLPRERDSLLLISLL